MKQHRTYRGKTLYKGEWVYGYYMYVNSTDRAYIITDWHETNGDLTRYEVVPDTVGQCTGRTSKSGKYIYEGDKVRANWYPGTEMVVKWLSEGRWNIADYTNAKGLTITGNIHDNGTEG